MWCSRSTKKSSKVSIDSTQFFMILLFLSILRDIVDDLEDISCEGDSASLKKKLEEIDFVNVQEAAKISTPSVS